MGEMQLFINAFKGTFLTEKEIRSIYLSLVNKTASPNKTPILIIAIRAIVSGRWRDNDREILGHIVGKKKIKYVMSYITKKMELNTSRFNARKEAQSATEATV